VPGHDINFQAIAGALAPRAGEAPQVPRLPVADLEGGTMSALLICAAWARRQIDGTGERIDVAMADVVAWWVGPHTGTAHDGAAARTFGSPGYGVFRARDGGWIALGVLGEPRLWAAICTALALDEWRDVPFEARAARADEVDRAIAAVIGDLDRDDALARLVDAGAPATPVLAPEQAVEDPQLRGRGFHVETAAGLVAGLPARFGDGTEGTAGSAARPSRVPGPGEHPGGFTAR